jgi:hypothetical protein
MTSAALGAVLGSYGGMPVSLPGAQQAAVVA